MYLLKKTCKGLLVNIFAGILVLVFTTLVHANGQTPFEKAAGDLSATKKLVEKGADVNKKDEGGFTPIRHNIFLLKNPYNSESDSQHCRETIEYLLSKGAKITPDNIEDVIGSCTSRDSHKKSLENVKYLISKDTSLLKYKKQFIEAVNRQKGIPGLGADEKKSCTAILEYFKTTGGKEDTSSTVPVKPDKPSSVSPSSPGKTTPVDTGLKSGKAPLVPLPIAPMDGVWAFSYGKTKTKVILGQEGEKISGRTDPIGNSGPIEIAGSITGNTVELFFTMNEGHIKSLTKDEKIANAVGTLTSKAVFKKGSNISNMQGTYYPEYALWKKDNQGNITVTERYERGQTHQSKPPQPCTLVRTVSQR